MNRLVAAAILLLLALAAYSFFHKPSIAITDPAAPPAAAADPMDRVWRILGLNDRQILDLKARAAGSPDGTGLHSGTNREILKLGPQPAQELKGSIENTLTHLKDDLKDAPAYIQQGIHALEDAQKSHDAEIHKAVQSLEESSGASQ